MTTGPKLSFRKLNWFLVKRLHLIAMFDGPEPLQTLPTIPRSNLARRRSSSLILTGTSGCAS
jgi:hypothetical protein